MQPRSSITSKTNRPTNLTIEGTFNITIFGQASVGKTSLVNFNKYNKFSNSYRPTTEANSESYITYNNKNYRFSITDTAGFEDTTRNVSDRHVLNRDGFIVVYSIANRESFEVASYLLEELRDLFNYDDSFPIILIGNKLDLERKGERRVEYEEGNECFENGLCDDFYETSIKTKFSEKEAPQEFLRILQLILRSRE